MDHVVLTIVAIGVLGIGAQWLAWRTQLPAIVLLLAAGLLAGPFTGLIDPEAVFGDLMKPMIAVAVAIILFEGGLTLNFREIAETSRSVRRLVLFGAPLAWGLGFVAAYYVAGLSAPSAAILSGIMVVTGPTVIMPLLRQARLPHRPAALLRWEAILVDPIGALFAVLAFEITLVVSAGHGSGEMLWRVPLALALSGALGYLLARAIAALFINGLIPDYLKSAVLLVGVLVGFETTNLLLEEAGLLTVTVMGVVLGNTRIASLDEMRRFKEVMTVLLVSGVFIILTATVSLADLLAVGWRDVAFVALLLFVVRPITVLLSTSGGEMTFQERLLCAWIAPRGVVAVAISAFFGAALLDAGFPDASRLAPLAFVVVLSTVVLHGLSIGPLARALGLASSEPQGLLIAGASPWTIELARTAREIGLPVLVADRNWSRLTPARLAHIPVYYGEILAEAAEHHVDMARYGALIAATDNDAYNALVCTDLGPEIGRSNTYQIGRAARPDNKDEAGQGAYDRRELSFHLGGRTLFRSGLGYWDIQRLMNEGWTFHKTTLTEEYDYETFLEERGDQVHVLFAMRASGRLAFSTTAQRIKAVPGDTIVSFGYQPEAKPSQAG